MRINKKGKRVYPSLSNRKSQAALEFLMTYGWAILVVLIVIGALAYFGVLNPTIMLPEKCTFQMGVYCKNHLIQLGTGMIDVDPIVNHSIFFELENGMGKGIIITEINVTGDSMNCGLTATNAAIGSQWNDNFGSKAGLHILQGRSKIISIYEPKLASDGSGMGGASPFMNCTLIPQIGKAKGDVRIRWYFDDATSAFTHTMNGEILANIEDLT